MSDNFIFSISLRVQDKAALYAAAHVRGLADGIEPEDLQDNIGTAADPDVGACLVMLIDPGSLEGCSINDSEAHDAETI